MPIGGVLEADSFVDETFTHFPSRQTGEMTGIKFDNAGKDQYGPQVSLPCLKCNP